MKLYIKSEYVQNKPGLTVYGQDEIKKYYVPIYYSVLGMKIDIYNSQSRRVSKIRQHGFSFNRTYNISADKKNIKFVLKIEENTISAHIKGINWVIDGDFSKKEFIILNENKDIIMLHKCIHNYKRFYYEVDIEAREYELLCLCIALCIDTLLFFNEKEIKSDRDFFIQSIFQNKKMLNGLKGTFSVDKMDKFMGNARYKIKKEEKRGS